MANIQKYVDNSNQSGECPNPHWRKVLKLPDDETVWDISTGKKYKRGEIIPVDVTGGNAKIEEFQIIGTEEFVHTRFLRF